MHRGEGGPETLSDYLKSRWITMVMWWNDRSFEARPRYFRLRLAVVIGGVCLPVLSTLNTYSTFVATIAISLVGAVVAGCAAWEGVANYGEIWREKRRAAELLKVEGWQFFALCGKYQKYQKDGSHKKAFPRFADEVEKMIAKEVGEYLAVFSPSPDQRTPPAGNGFGLNRDPKELGSPETEVRT
jgi:hypothetical protein